MAYRISNNGINQIKKHEGVEYRMYRDVAGYPTIGVGHLILATEKHLLTKTLTESEVDELLRKDIARFEKNLNAVVKVPLNQNQVDALLSLMFNIGSGAFNKSSILKRLNQKDYLRAANNFTLWNKAGGKVVQGLVNRRLQERTLFLSPIN
ncbi:lysozyme [Rufibacter immobilis]|uniref:Lysozyme n=1 Tax=Rufibacter immobilis TaxID=1348778 RepID=A0A3M9MZF2_9BACT|nr:lysozyme [Rufibacter immobilis]RNI30942.1 lysozyme [Rufibacter immobilis]